MPDILIKPQYDLVARRVTTPVLTTGQFYDIQEPHSFFRVETGVNVQAFIDAKPPAIDYPAGTGYKYSEYVVVNLCRVVNNDAGAQAITFYYGSGQFLDTRVTLAGSLVVTSITNPVRALKPATSTVGQVSVGNAATLIAAANANRYANTIQNGMVSDLYIGPTNAVTTANGFLIPIGGSHTLESPDDVYGIRVGAAQTAYFRSEVY